MGIPKLAKRGFLSAAMVSLLCVVLACGLASCGGDSKKPNREALAAKPVIYLYPEQACEVKVSLSFDGELTCVYPSFAESLPAEGRDGGTWTVVAQPDGTLADPCTGREYGYLFWEGLQATEPDMSQGFCVAGADTEGFLEDSLARLGLTDREAADFITYWLPRMQGNAYNLISFQGGAYEDAACLSVDPAPDTVIRVFMAWCPFDEPVDVEPQELDAPDRGGFTLVEWGGTEL